MLMLGAELRVTCDINLILCEVMHASPLHNYMYYRSYIAESESYLLQSDYLKKVPNLITAKSSCCTVMKLRMKIFHGGTDHFAKFKCDFLVNSHQFCLTSKYTRQGN